MFFPILTVLLDLKYIPLIIKNSPQRRCSLKWWWNILLCRQDPFYCLHLDSLISTVPSLPNSTMTDISAFIKASLSTIWIPLEKKKCGKAGKSLKKEKESPGIPHPRDSGVSSVNCSVDVGRSCLLYSTKEQNTNTSRLLHTLPMLVTAAEAGLPTPSGPAHPTAITTLPSILHSPLTNLSLHYVFPPNFRLFPSGMFPRVQSVGQKVRTCMSSLWHGLQVSILFFP